MPPIGSSRPTSSSHTGLEEEDNRENGEKGSKDSQEQNSYQENSQMQTCSHENEIPVKASTSKEIG